MASCTWFKSLIPGGFIALRIFTFCASPGDACFTVLHGQFSAEYEMCSIFVLLSLVIGLSGYQCCRNVSAPFQWEVAWKFSFCSHKGAAEFYYIHGRFTLLCHIHKKENDRTIFYLVEVATSPDHRRQGSSWVMA